MGVTGLTIGSSAIGSAAADDTTGLVGVVYHGDENHSTIPEFRIVLIGPEKYEANIDEDDKDYYDFDVVPGEYKVLVTASGYSETVETITVESASTQKQNFVLEPANSGTLNGKVVTKSGESIDSDQLTVDLDGEYYPLTTSIDSNGEFEIDLQEGEWEVTPDILGYEGDPETVSISEDEPENVELEVSSTNKADLTLIVDLAGEPAEKRILFSGTAIENRTLGPEETRLEDTVEAGTYDIAVEADGHYSEVDLDVELEPGSQNYLYYELEEL